MATIIAPPKPERPVPGGPGGLPPGGGGFSGGGSGGNWSGGPDEAALRISRYKTGTWFGLGAVVMVFAGFVSAYVVRRGLSTDWRPIQLPGVLGFSTAVLLLSSLTLERARRSLNGSSLTWLRITSLLGVVFLAGQYAAWRQLAAAGVYLASNPASSFFYVLTGAHGLHLLGGVLALFYVTARAPNLAWAGREAATQSLALYWHFMDGLWVFLFFLMVVGR
jgi:cytochrome c oxidase subunit 3